MKKKIEIQKRAKCGYCGSYVKMHGASCKKCGRVFEGYESLTNF